jgi:hypothetical protein
MEAGGARAICRLTTQITLFALFALPSQEAIYLFATDDADGKKLNGNSDYTIEGNIHDIKTVYWSITAYGNDQFLIPNEANRYSFNANNLITDSLGNYKIIISSVRKPGNWLPVKKETKFKFWWPFNKPATFRLVLRLYQGQKDFIAHLDNAHLPVIKKI